MTFDARLVQVLELLQREKRVSSRASKIVPQPPAPQDQAAVQLPAPLGTAPVPEAERRQLTVLFCDLVDSITLAPQLDPEDLRDVVRAYQRTCSEVIQRCEGHIAKHSSSGYLKETDGHYALTGALSSLAIPSALQDSLMARLDRLLTAKAVAQHASVIGRQFTGSVLQVEMAT